MMYFVYAFSLFVAFVNGSPSTRLSKKSPYLQRNGFRDIQNVLRNSEIQSAIGNRTSPLLDLSPAAVSGKTGCKCAKNQCQCCLHIDVKEIHLDDDVCVKLAYLPTEYGIEVSVTIGGKTIFDDKISAKNPPPFCVDVPHLKKLASVCIDFHDMNVSKTSIHGCLKFEAKLIKIKVADVELGCFTIPLKSQEQGRQPAWNRHVDIQGRESNAATLEDKLFS